MGQHGMGVEMVWSVRARWESEASAERIERGAGVCASMGGEGWPLTERDGQRDDGDKVEQTIPQKGAPCE